MIKRMVLQGAIAAIVVAALAYLYQFGVVLVL
jgi:hypothetical protein